MKPRDVVWVSFPTGAGRAQHGRRPAIVAQSEAASGELPTVLVVPLTTQQDALRFPGTVLVEPTPENSRNRHSIALIFQLTAVDARVIDSPVGSVSQSAMDQIWSALDQISRGEGTPDGNAGA